MISDEPLRWFSADKLCCRLIKVAGCSTAPGNNFLLIFCSDYWHSLAGLQMQTLSIRLPCLRILWNLSTCFPNLKIILRSRPSIFKFHLMRAVIFCSGSFRVCNRSKQGEPVPPRNFWIRFYKSDFKSTCWTSPKPDIPHKIALATRFRWYRISKFSWIKICSMKIGVDSFNIASNRSYLFRFWR